MNTEKILIIEDEELIREELKTLLSNAGYVVDCVVDFGETLNYIKLTSPDLILLDVNLPGQDGYRLCTSIRSFAAIPIAGYFFKQILSSKDVMKHLMPSKIMTLEWIGAHSLEIYIIHQPLIYVVLLAIL